jgi:sarcosine oxidase gamma subunit
MEMLCMLDLHPSVFPAGASARTPIEGMHALVACEDAEAGTFVLYFQRSSGRSFVDHIRHAAHGTCPRD